MKIISALCLSGSFILFTGCEQQSWEDTKIFNQNPPSHNSHGHAPDAAKPAASAESDSGSRQ